MNTLGGVHIVKLVCLSMGFLSALVYGQSTLRFVVNTPGSFPYMYLEQGSREYIGLVSDILSDYARQHDKRIVYIDSNQWRSEKMLLEGTADLHFMNPAWLKDPARQIVTSPVVEHATYLYSIVPFAADFTLTHASERLICTRQGWTYTGLSESLLRGHVHRVDATSNKNMVKMLVAGRCDYAIFNDYNAHWAFSSVDFCGQTFYQSPEPTSKVPVSFILRPELADVKVALDKYIEERRPKGHFLSVLRRYSPQPSFPMLPRC